MKALLIGGAGYLGRSLCAAMAQDGFDLLVGQHKTISSAALAPKVRVVPFSLEDTDAAKRLLDEERPDVILHLASTLLPASDATEYLQERSTIIEPTLRLLLDLGERMVPLVFFSSGGAIYGQSEERAPNEESVCRPISFYGQAKLELEEIIRFLGRTRRLPSLVVRPSNPFGGSQSLGGRQGLIAAVLKCVRDQQPLRVWGDGKVVRDYIYIDDFCKAVSRLIAERATGIVNVGSGVGHSVLDVVRTVEQVVARPVDVEFLPARPVDVPRIVLDVSRAASLGAPPARPFHEGVRRFAADLGIIDG